MGSEDKRRDTPATGEPAIRDCYDKKACPKCGARISPGMDSCPRCGLDLKVMAQLDSLGAAAEHQRRESQTKKEGLLRRQRQAAAAKAWSAAGFGLLMLVILPPLLLALFSPHSPDIMADIRSMFLGELIFLLIEGLMFLILYVSMAFLRACIAVVIPMAAALIIYVGWHPKPAVITLVCAAAYFFICRNIYMNKFGPDAPSEQANDQ